jgi:hypothetical protein
MDRVPLSPNPQQFSNGLTCQPFYFGEHPNLVWREEQNNEDELRKLIYEEKKHASLRTIRVLRFYSENVILLVKPDRLRYWIRSTAIRDADETLVDLRQLRILNMKSKHDEKEARLYNIYDPILVLECKRLPAPSSDREREYVTGGKERKSGGIQRFKLGLHGAELDLVAMIGYVQERSAHEWHQDINKWITDLCSGVMADGCVWRYDETLEQFEEDVSKGISSCRSVHGRTGSRASNEIEIDHLWIVMNLRQTQADHD